MSQLKGAFATVVGLGLALSSTWSVAAFALIDANRGESTVQIAQRYPEVVRLQAGREVCTGTIVGPRVILSAAHCASLKNAYFEYRRRRYPVRFSASPDYASKGHDISLAITTKAIRDARYGTIVSAGAESGSGAESAPPRSGSLKGPQVKHGSILELAGYGCTHAGGKSGALHEGTTQVIGMDQDHLLSFAPNGSVLCPGDSGGPAYLGQGRHRYVVAVNTAGNVKNVNLNVRLDSALSQTFLKRTADRWHVKICGVNLDCQKVPGTFFGSHRVKSMAPEAKRRWASL